MNDSFLLLKCEIQKNVLFLVETSSTKLETLSALSILMILQVNLQSKKEHSKQLFIYRSTFKPGFYPSSQNISHQFLSHT